MTLVYVKRNLDNEFTIVADTQVTSNNFCCGRTERDLSNQIPGALKILILDEHFTMGYAGVCEYAINALRDIWSSNFSKDEILTIIEKHYKKSTDANAGTDFLLCDHACSVTYKWENGFDKIQTEQDCWIGNSKAAAALNGELKNFESIMESDDFPNVGGFKVVIESCHRRFKYAALTSTQTESKKHGGGFHYAIATPHSSLPLVGIYFQRERWGYLYNHVSKDEPIIIYGNSGEEFVQELHRHTNVEFYVAPAETADGSGFVYPGQQMIITIANAPKCPYVWSKDIRKTLTNGANVEDII